MPRQIVLGDVVEETANVAQDFRRQFDARPAFLRQCLAGVVLLHLVRCLFQRVFRSDGGGHGGAVGTAYIGSHRVSIFEETIRYISLEGIAPEMGIA